MKRKELFRYSSDLRPVLSVMGIVSLSLLPFLVPMSLPLLVPYALLVLYLRTYAPYAQHNHGHLPVFHSKVLNGLYDLFLSQCTGYATALWELHHVRGHHRNFLTPEKDVARITHLSTGQVMSRSWYSLRGNFTIVGDSFQIAREEVQAGKKDLAPKLRMELFFQLLITALLAVWNPWLTLTFFVLPNFVMSWCIWWESYVHHLDVPMNDAYDGSVTITRSWFNFQTFNIGHHTAHHEKPTLHWSMLPERTSAILERIPETCLR
jgi:fatty acid desaturase